MQIRALALFVLFLFVPLLPAEETPTLRGFVTDPGTPARFQVNGYDVLCTNLQTLTNRQEGSFLRGTTVCPQHFLGEQVLVYGREDKRQTLIHANQLTLVPPKDQAVEGASFTDQILVKNANEVVVRADGYLLHISRDTKMTYDSTLVASFDSFQTNQWLSYRGIAHPDGTVMVQSANLVPNVITDSEDELRSKHDFDASSISDADRQSGVSKLLTGIDRTRIPAYDDPTLQARVDAIGSRLIPAYQRSLPENDPSRIRFRFQLVEDTKYAYYPLPSGIILLSRTVAEQAPNDSQIAAILATAIASVVQKQELRARPAAHAMRAGQVAGDVAGLFLPGASLLPLVTNTGVRERMIRLAMQQNARESLCLMHDAGFDLRQAPLAIWGMAQKPGQPLAQAAMSEHVRYLYELLGTAWRDEDMPLPKLTRAQASTDSATSSR